ncbi:hypothetical protein GPECTOR_9g661 [Gonium pectorale]|uniref:Uncharacterized protein n=1 Tax=Gonium pectorale TaxID=33097 RepID=A0A150GRZ7_GONPE|nr:hypothetical protein GPECTOR_9g661 [Gonium pectorale]|eukprot:KXZ52616.1 hypothetical protein GPECTOR_9g661 [Gonium pectorale]
MPAARSPPPPPPSPSSSSLLATAAASAGAPSLPSPAVPGLPAGQQGAAAAASLPYLSSVPEVALRLSCLGHRVVLRRVVDTKQYWSKSMTNAFCYVVLPGTGIGYVLDPGFKEHFRAGCMSDRYRDIWECLPPLFVGPPAKLVQLVQLLCSELGASFEAAGRQLPPWRTFNATINRWMSPVFRDLPAPLRRTVAGAAAAGAPCGGVAGAGGEGGAVPIAPCVSPGMIPASEVQAFLRSCEELLAGTASTQSASADPRVSGPRSDISSAAAAATGIGVAQGSGSGVLVAAPGQHAQC